MRIVLLLVLLWGTRVAAAIEPMEAAELARAYLAAGDDARRAELAGRLNAYRGEVQPIVDLLARREFTAAENETATNESLVDPHFTGERRDKRPDDLLYFNVPKSYRPDRPTGLIIFMHGGGGTTPRERAKAFVEFPGEGGKRDPNQVGDLLSATGMISVAPSAPWDERSPSRWCIESADDFLADVIAECKSRFNIDADRVLLVGHSMGGFGAFHHMQRQPDRFAAIVSIAGAWRFAYLPAVRGTKLGVIQAVHDARENVRPHYTDIEFGRQTAKLLVDQQLDHIYIEHDGGHALQDARDALAEFFKSSGAARRDPFAPRIALASPAGFKATCLFPVQHNRWLSLDEATDGEIELDELHSTGGKDFNAWRLHHRVAKRPGASIEAVNRGDNSLDVTTRNVKRLTLWLHPRMVDVDQPVTVRVNGKQQFTEELSPSLVTALDSYRRRGDWGLIYPMKLEVTVGQ